VGGRSTAARRLIMRHELAEVKFSGENCARRPSAVWLVGSDLSYVSSTSTELSPSTTSFEVILFVTSDPRNLLIINEALY
jgi:hypothetical protein